MVLDATLLILHYSTEMGKNHHDVVFGRSFVEADEANQGVIKGGHRGETQAPPIFRTTKRSMFTTNTQSRFASVVLDGVLGHLHLALYT